MEDDIKGSIASSENKTIPNLNFNESKHDNSMFIQNEDKIVEDLRKSNEDNKAEIFEYELYQFKLKHELNNLRTSQDDFEKKIREVGKYSKQNEVSLFSILLFGLIGLFCGIYFTNTIKNLILFLDSVHQLFKLLKKCSYVSFIL